MTAGENRVELASSFAPPKPELYLLGRGARVIWAFLGEEASMGE